MAISEYKGQGPLTPRQGADKSLDEIDNFEIGQTPNRTTPIIPSEQKDDKWQRVDMPNLGATERAPALDFSVEGQGRIVQNKPDYSQAIVTEQTPKIAAGNEGSLELEQIRKMEKKYGITVREAFDLNGDGTFSKGEAEKLAEAEKKLVANLDPELRKKVREGFENGSKSATDEKIAELTGLKVEKGATDIVKQGMREGLDDADAKDKDGKDKDHKVAGEKKEKNFFEALIDLLKTFAVALGIMEDPNKNKDAELAKKDGTPENGEKAKGEGKEKEHDRKLTAEEKKGAEFIAKLGEDIQNSIKNAGLKDTGIMLAGLPKEFTPQAQIVGAKLPASDLQERG